MQEHVQCGRFRHLDRDPDGVFRLLQPDPLDQQRHRLVGQGPTVVLQRCEVGPVAVSPFQGGTDDTRALAVQTAHQLLGDGSGHGGIGPMVPSFGVELRRHTATQVGTADSDHRIEVRVLVGKAFIERADGHLRVFGEARDGDLFVIAVCQQLAGSFIEPVGLVIPAALAGTTTLAGLEQTEHPNLLQFRIVMAQHLFSSDILCR